MENFKNVLKHKYATFEGRASRNEYWMFVLFSMIFSFIAGFIDGALGLEFGRHDIGVLGTIYGLLVLIPSIAILVRRLYDTNHSAWWLFILLLPVIGFIVILVFLLQDSTPGTNKYGPNPKEPTPPVPPASEPTPPTPTLAV